MKAKIFVCIALLCSARLLSQDIESIHLNNEWLRLNPAYAGSNGGFRTQIHSSSTLRDGSIAQTAIASDMYLKKIKSGISVSLNSLHLNRGIMIENAFSVGYSKRIQIKNIEIVPAIQIVGLLKSVDLNALNFGDVIDPRWDERFQFFRIGSIPSSSRKTLDFNAGALLNLKNGFVLGFATRHITQPDIGVAGTLKMPAKYILHASYDKVVNENKLLNVFVSLSEQNGTEEARLQASAVFMKHLYFGIGGVISNNYYTNSALLGYRGNLWTLTAAMSTSHFVDSKYYPNRAELALSINIRDKEHRRSLTTLQAW